MFLKVNKDVFQEKPYKIKGYGYITFTSPLSLTK